VVKEFKVYKVKEVESLSSCIKEFLEEVPQTLYPKIGVVGIAGPIINNTV